MWSGGIELKTTIRTATSHDGDQSNVLWMLSVVDFGNDATMATVA